MHSIRIHQVIDRMISFFRRIGIWHGEDMPTMVQLRLKSFYTIYLMFVCTSFAVGAIKKETVDESVFLAEATIVASVMTAKLWFLLWKQKQIKQLLNRICVFSIRNDEEFAFFNDKMGKFVKFVIVFACATIIGSLGCSVVPFIGNSRNFIVDFAFPLDWKNSEIGFWMAYIFFVSGNALWMLTLTFSVIIWYLLLHCSLRLIDELESFLSKLFLLQFATSGVCICGSIYCLAFDLAVNFVERIVHVYSLFFCLAELFMITYLGNEIMLSSSGLTYSLFESEWIGKPHSTQKCIIIFGEYLKRSHEMLIGRLYPLTLETFTRILNSSYTLFNILKNF